MKPACYGIIAAAVLFPAALFGHGVEVYDADGETTGAAHTVRFMYSTGEPMMYAKIFLYPPSNPRTEILQSIADRNGYFSFVPDESGEWRISAEDGMGHKGEIMLSAGGVEALSGESENAAGQRGKPAPFHLLILKLFDLIPDRIHDISIRYQQLRTQHGDPYLYRWRLFR